MNTVYPLTNKLKDRLANTFTYHAPFGDQQARYVKIREEAHKFAILLATTTPESREQSLAITKLEEAVFYANAAIARNETQFAGEVKALPQT